MTAPHSDRCASLLGQGCDCRSPWATDTAGSAGQDRIPDTAATDGPVPCSCGAASCVRPAIHQRCRGCGEGWSAGQVIVVAGGDYGNVYMHEGCVQP